MVEKCYSLSLMLNCFKPVKYCRYTFAESQYSWKLEWWLILEDGRKLISIKILLICVSKCTTQYLFSLFFNLGISLCFVFTCQLLQVMKYQGVQKIINYWRYTVNNVKKSWCEFHITSLKIYKVWLEQHKHVIQPRPVAAETSVLFL